MLHVAVLVCLHAGDCSYTMKTEWEFSEKVLAFAILAGLVVALIIVPWLLELGD